MVLYTQVRSYRILQCAKVCSYTAKGTLDYYTSVIALRREIEKCNCLHLRETVGNRRSCEPGSQVTRHAAHI